MTKHPRRIVALGLGSMGAAMAVRLHKAGWIVSGRDIDAAAESRGAAAGVKTASDDDIRSADILISSLPADESVLEALTGASGMLARMRRGSVLIETSTILPTTIHRIQAAASRSGVDVIDCGLSGGPADAGAGTLTVIVGGDAVTIAAAGEVLADLGTVVRAGEIGDAKTVKLVNNVMSIGNVVVAAEAFNLGLRAGIQATRLMELLSVSGGRSHQFSKRFPRLLERDFTPRFALALGLKDTRLAMRLAGELGLRLESTAAVAGTLEKAVGAGLGAEDLVAVAKLYERTEELSRGND